MLLATLTLAPDKRIEEIIGDHTLPHVAIPRGVPEGVNWRVSPRVGAGNNPGEFRAFIVWGQVYEPVGDNPSKNSRVQIQNIQAWIKSKQTGKWSRVQHSKDVQGSFYREDFSDDANEAGDERREPDGTTSIRTKPGFNFHFWTPKGRVPIDPADIGGVYTAVQARLILTDPKGPDDRKQARFMMSMGADYWKELDSKWDYWKTNGDAMIGRFRWITPQWQWFHAITLSPEEVRKSPPPAPFAGR